MLEEELTRLTIDGVVELLSQSSFPGRSFTLQVLTLTSNYLGHHFTELSDGFCKIQCQLGIELKKLVQSLKLLDNAIIKFDIGQCQVIADKVNPYIILQNCQVLKPQMEKVIGAPMPFKLYKEKNFQNPEASNLIDNGPRVYSIRDVINNTRIKNGRIRATVTKLADNMSRGLFIFHIKDSEETEIQGVCFQEAAQLFFKELKLNNQYLFSGYILQKNKKTNQDELKFKKQGQITRIIKNQQGETKFQKVNEIKQYFTNQNVQEQKPFEEKIKQEENQQDKPLTKRQIMDLIKEEKTAGKLYTIVGKVIYLNVKSKYRKINIEDRNKDTIDVLLWQQIKSTMLMQKVYKITNLRLKHRANLKETKYIEMQSITNRTKVIPFDTLQFQVMCITPKCHQPYNPKTKIEPSFRQENTKQIFQKSKIISINQLIRTNEEEGNEVNRNSLYPLVQCTLKFRTEGLRYKDESDINNYFNFFCKPCEKVGTVSLGDNQTVFCNRCKRDDIQIKWNLRVRVMDLHNQLPCSIQSETTERFLNLTSREGYLLFSESKEQFEKLLHRVNFENRVCKFQVKTIGLNKYYNILQIYAKNSQILLQKHLIGLKRGLKLYPTGQEQKILQKVQIN